MSGTILRNQAIVDIQRETRKRAAGVAPVDVVPERKPMFETNLVETLGIRKFLVFAMEDVRLQVEQAARTSRTRREFDEVKAGADVLVTWIAGNLALVDGMLQAGSPMKRDDKQDG